MQLIYFLVIGLVAGWLAGQIMKGGGFGLVGAIFLLVAVIYHTSLQSALTEYQELTEVVAEFQSNYHHHFDRLLDRLVAAAHDSDHLVAEEGPVAERAVGNAHVRETLFALGAERRMSDKITLRAGYNHGNSPVPDETLNPMFPATAKRSVTS